MVHWIRPTRTAAFWPDVGASTVRCCWKPTSPTLSLPNLAVELILTYPQLSGCQGGGTLRYSSNSAADPDAVPLPDLAWARDQALRRRRPDHFSVDLLAGLSIDRRLRRRCRSVTDFAIDKNPSVNLTS